MVGVASGCGEDPLSGLGEGSSDWIAEPQPPVTAPPSTRAPVEFVSAGLVEWWNDDLGRPEVPERGAVLAEVTVRRDDGQRFVQASRWEIAAVLPSLRFPARVPSEVRSITSQLVLRTDGPQLDPDLHAAFGFWVAEPYSRSRQAGRVGTLEVGPAVEPAACEPPGCRPEQIGPVEVQLRDLGSAVSASWNLDGLSYTLEAETLDQAEAMVASLRSLTDLAPVVDSEPAGQASEGVNDGR